MFGLFGGDFGDGVGVFFLVDDSDISADDMGDTRAEDLAENSRWASLNMLMYSGSCPKGSPGTGVVRRGDWGKEKTPENSLDRSTQEPHLELEEVGGVSILIWFLSATFILVQRLF